jgi:hypothetical protein
LYVNIEKYCKFKAVDIFKCIKQGVVPKRGGPKEEESELTKELDNMILDDKKSNETNTENNNQSEEQKRHDDINQYNYTNKEHNNSNLTDPKDLPKQSTIPEDAPNQYVVPETKDVSKPEPKNESKQKEVPKPKDRQEIKKVTKEETKYTHTKHDDFKLESPPRKNNLTQSTLLSNDYQIDASIKKLDYKLPVKFKTPDYFRLTDTIKKELDHAQRELNSNKIEKTLSMAELALYYLNNIKT